MDRMPEPNKKGESPKIPSELMPENVRGNGIMTRAKCVELATRIRDKINSFRGEDGEIDAEMKTDFEEIGAAIVRLSSKESLSKIKFKDGTTVESVPQELVNALEELSMKYSVTQIIPFPNKK